MAQPPFLYKDFFSDFFRQIESPVDLHHLVLTCRFFHEQALLHITPQLAFQLVEGAFKQRSILTVHRIFRYFQFSSRDLFPLLLYHFPEGLQFLLDQGLRDEGNQAFDHAILRDWDDNVKVLLPYLWNKDWALFIACSKEFPDLIPRLIQSGADPNSYYATYIAITKKRWNCLTVLIQCGANRQRLQLMIRDHHDQIPVSFMAET